MLRLRVGADYKVIVIWVLVTLKLSNWRLMGNVKRMLMGVTMITFYKTA